MVRGLPENIIAVPPTGVPPVVWLQEESKRYRTGNPCLTPCTVTPGPGAPNVGHTAMWVCRDMAQGDSRTWMVILGYQCLPWTLQILGCVKWGSKKLPSISVTRRVFAFKIEDLLTHYFSPDHFLLAWVSCHFLGRTAPQVQDLVNSSLFTPYVQVQGGQRRVSTVLPL